MAVEGEAVGLDGEGAGEDGRQEQPQGVGEAGTDDDAFGVGAYATGARQVVGEGAAQLGTATGVAGAEGVVGGGGQRAAGGGEPGGTREGGGVRLALEEVVRGAARRGAVGRGAGGRQRLRALGHGGAGALPGAQPALRHQFGVGVGDGVTGDAEVGGERAIGRQAGAGGEPPGPYGVPQRPDEDGAAAAGSGQLQMQIGAQALGTLGRIDP